jgi:hypothetical protein
LTGQRPRHLLTWEEQEVSMNQRDRERRTDEQRPAKPPVDAYDPFEQMFRPKRPTDSFGEMFEEKIRNDEF